MRLFPTLFAAGICAAAIIIYTVSLLRQLRSRRIPVGSAAAAVVAATAAAFSFLFAGSPSAPAVLPGVIFYAVLTATTLVLLAWMWRERSAAATLMDATAVPNAWTSAVLLLVTQPLYWSAAAGHWNALAFGASLLIVMHISSESEAAINFQRPAGLVFGQMLVLTAVVQFAVARLSRAAPPVIIAVAGMACAAGIVLVGVSLNRMRSETEERRILAHTASFGEQVQPEYSPPSAECPNPQRWSMYDSMTAEVEVLDFLYALVRALKPRLIVETGTFTGVSTLRMAAAMRDNGGGRIITVEYDPKAHAAAQQRFAASDVGRYIECRHASSLQTSVEGTIDLLFSDSDPSIREQEVRRFLPQMSANSLVLMHDSASVYPHVREAALRLEREGLISMVLLPTPRGLVVAQKKSTA
jgi:predicted O-methyltransferase YrrM